MTMQQMMIQQVWKQQVWVVMVVVGVVRVAQLALWRVSCVLVVVVVAGRQRHPHDPSSHCPISWLFYSPLQLRHVCGRIQK